MRRTTAIARYTYWLIALALVGLAALEGFAQSPFFSTLSVREGLPSNVIAAVAQDTHDFIWIGTANGLCRYDGERFLTFKKGESTHSLPANNVNSLVVDGDYLWVGTWNGLCKLNTTTFDITRYDLGPEASTIRTLCLGTDGALWAGTGGGLCCLRDTGDTGDTFTLTRYTHENSGLSHNTVRSLYQDPQGNLWVGTYNQLNKLPPGAHHFETYDLKGSYKPSLQNNLISGDIRPVAHSGDSLLWVGTETGLCRFHTRTGAVDVYNEKNTAFSNEVIKCIYPDDQGNLWLGTDFGLNVLNPATGQNHTYFHHPQQPYAIANNVIWQIFEDRGGVRWFVTANGLSRLNKYSDFYQYHPVSYTFENQTIGNQVKAILVTEQGIRWLATLHGVIRIDPARGTQQIFDTHAPAPYRILLNNVYALEEDAYGRVWIGTAGGINVWDEATHTMHAFTANDTSGLTSNYIARFTRGDDGSFWVSAWEGGLFEVTGDLANLQHIRFQYAGDFGTAQNVGAARALWAIQYNHLYKIDLQTHAQQPISAFNQLVQGRDIGCLYYAYGSLWAGTHQGVIEYNPDQDTAWFHPIETGNELLIDNLLADDAGHLWSAVHNLLLKFNTADQRVALFPLDKDIPLKSFFAGCTARTADGRLLFGGDNGYLSVCPTIRPNLYQPRVCITTLEVNNKVLHTGDTTGTLPILPQDVSQLQTLVLPATQRSLGFHFAALHYWQPAMNIYAYTLEGFDDDWHYTSGQRNFAVYTNLVPGTYTLRVKGTNNYGVWSEHEATLALRIKPPLLLSRGFMILYIALALLLTYLGLRIYSVRLKLKNQLKIARLEKAHAEELADTKQQFFTNISHELRTPISLILPPIQKILQAGHLSDHQQNLIALAEKNAHRLLRVVNQILDVRKLENDSLPLKISTFDLVAFCRDLCTLFTDKATRKQITFTFETTVDPCPVWADTEKIETVFFNLLSNAFKFTPKQGTIQLSVTTHPPDEQHLQGTVEVVVADSGIGIAREEQARIFERFYQTHEARTLALGSGIGLTLAAEYLKLHHGTITVDSTPGQGTRFVLCLPLGNDHFPLETIHPQQEINLLATRTPASPPADTPYQLGPASDKPMVLLIEDNPDMRQFITVSLQDKYHFLTAEDGEAGLAKAISFLPAMIISDVMMPVMDGLTLCRKVKDNPHTSHIPVILLTAQTDTAQKVAGIRHGADLYVTKPFEVELLEAHIDHLLKRQQELADYFRQELMLLPPPGEAEHADHTFIRKIMRIIEANVANPTFSVEKLSEEAGMSSAHLYRKLKQLTHLSTNDIIRKYRLKKASLLLRNQDGNITEAMYAVGFSNSSYFSKCFRAEFGLSPKEYQQNVASSTPNEVDIFK